MDEIGWNPQELNLEGTKLTAAGLLNLKKLRNLKKLTIDGTEITHADVVRLYLKQGRGTLDALVATGLLLGRPPDESEVLELRLNGRQVTDELIEYLVPMPMLESLFLESTAVTATGLKMLSDMPQLKALRLRVMCLEKTACGAFPAKTFLCSTRSRTNMAPWAFAWHGDDSSPEAPV